MKMTDNSGETDGFVYLEVEASHESGEWPRGSHEYFVKVPGT